MTIIQKIILCGLCVGMSSVSFSQEPTPYIKKIMGKVEALKAKVESLKQDTTMNETEKTQKIGALEGEIKYNEGILEYDKKYPAQSK